MAEIMWLQHALDLLFRKIQKMSLNVFPHAARRPPECQKSFLSEAITKKLTSCTLKNTKYRKLLLNIVVGVWVAHACIVSSISQTHTHNKKKKSCWVFYVCVCVLTAGLRALQSVRAPCEPNEILFMCFGSFAIFHAARASWFQPPSPS